MIKVLAFDPGFTTGVASGLIDTDVGSMEVGSSQHKWDVDHLWKHLHEVVPDIIVYERFEHRQGRQDKLELFSKELIGVIRLYNAVVNTEIKLYDQSPTIIGGFFTDRELKDTNVYKTSHPHANDAMRHILQWFTFGPGYKFNTSGYSPS